MQPFVRIANRSRVRPPRTDPRRSWPLTTGHRPLQSRKSAPAVPCKRLRNVLYCKVEPEHNQSGPKRPAAHNCPPALLRHPTMSTCTELNVRTLPPAHIAPGAAAANQNCATLPSAAPPTLSSGKRAMPPMPVQPPPGSVSCHETRETVAELRTFCTKTTFLAHFLSKTDRELTATASCYESPCHYPVTRREKVSSKLGQSGQNSASDTLSIPCRYPVSEEFPVGLRLIRTLLSQYRTDSAPFLPTCAALTTRRPTPPLTSTLNSTLISARAGEVARDRALYSPNKAGGLHPRHRLLRGQPPVRQRRNQVDVSWSHDEVWAMPPHRTRLPSQQWREYPA